MGLLNRRHLRIKVLQALYAFQQSDNQSIVKGEKELFHSIDTVYHLYFRLLSIFPELHHQALLRMEENRNKIRPTADDLNPKRAFVDNKALLLLVHNQHLAAHVKHYKINWSQEDVALRKLFTAIQASEEYKSYMAKENISFEDEKDFLHTLFKKYIANYPALHEILDELSIYWQDDLDLVCVMVLKTIKDMKASDGEFTDLKPLYKDEDDDAEFARQLFFQSAKNMEEHLALIDKHTGNWEIDRIAVMDQLLMNLAISEARYFSNIPLKVTLNEYIEISKFYSTPKSNGFINGILDKVYDELKSTGQINKSGRGLMN